ncbi:MAG: glycosyltransferase family 4 protein [Solirubrobacterales bacterium]|nr:glycosyltransferase family 4 protein [Solirubrobacterales bacterium]
MRILVVTNFYPPVTFGGYETCCGLVVDRLRERHDVRVLTSDHGAEQAPTESWIWRRLPLFSGVSGDTLTAGLVTRRAIREVRRALRESDLDLVFVWAGARIPKGALRALETCGVPLAFSILDYWFDRPYDHDPFVRYLVGREKQARAVWSVATRVMNRLPSLRVDLSSATPAAVCWCSETTRRLTSVSSTIEPVLQETIHLATIHQRRLCAVQRKPDERTTILFVGRISREKGPDVALRALAALQRDHGIEARLVMCGPPAPGIDRELRALAEELDIAERVRMIGAVAAEPLAEMLGRAHVLLVPSTWQEPFGLVWLEGALARVPLVASRTGGITEMLHEEQHALFFSTADTTAAAAAIARVLTQPVETAARVSRAYARAKEFSIARYLDHSEAFVERAGELLTRRGAPR